MVLGDQPRLAPEAIARVLAAADDGAEAVRATYGGEPGHPVLLERALFGRLRDVSGDRGARNLLRASRRSRCPATTSAEARTWTRPDQLEALRDAASGRDEARAVVRGRGSAGAGLGRPDRRPARGALPPGAEITEAREDGTYRGNFTVKLGPTTAAYRGELRLEEVDEARAGS